MIKDRIQQNENITLNSRQLTVLKEHFPACFKADGSFDLERFKAEIAITTNIVNEGYELKFLGKSYAKLLASNETTTVLQPNEAHNNLPENTNSENIYISGDNLDGLKHLLKSYSGAVKCIYIDPPYNTGSDGFVYTDNFNYNKENLQEKLNISEEEAERILDLTKRGSASHSAWLMFMYSRLLLARDILTDDGVIFISIDENEQANLKLLCDDVFGEENCVAQITVLCNPKGRSQDKYFATNHEFLTVYSKKVLEKGSLSIFKSQEQIEKEYNEIDENGKYRSVELRNTHREFGKHNRENLYYPFFVNPDTSLVSLKKDEDYRFEIYPIWDDGFEGCWTWDTKNASENLNLLVAKPINGKWKIYRKSYSEGAVKMLKTIFNDKSFYTEKGQAEFNDLFESKNKIFQAPKSVELLRSVLNTRLKSKDIVLDFFSGSATTAHAVMKLNADDGGQRKFILVQLPEVLSPDIDSKKIAYEFLKGNNFPTTLDYIGIERIKRAATRIKEAYPNKVLDLGFKHYTLQEPNQNTLDKLDSFEKAGMLADTTVLEDFGKPTILTTWLNADGYGLTAKPEAINLVGYTAYYCQKHLYLIEPNFSLESMKALLSKYDAEGHFNPENVVLFGYSFPDWSINEMIEKNLRILNDGEKNLKINFIVRY